MLLNVNSVQEACQKCAYVVPVYEIKSTIGKHEALNIKRNANASPGAA